MKFHAIRTGHIRNAKSLLLRNKLCTEAQLELMSDEEVDALISEQYVAVILQKEASDYDDIYLIPKGDWSSVFSISR